MNFVAEADAVFVGHTHDWVREATEVRGRDRFCCWPGLTMPLILAFTSYGSFRAESRKL
jgi:hypothetical protein